MSVVRIYSNKASLSSDDGRELRDKISMFVRRGRRTDTNIWFHEQEPENIAVLWWETLKKMELSLPEYELFIYYLFILV